MCFYQDIHPWQTSALLVFFVAVAVQNNACFYFTLILNNVNITRSIGHVLQDMMKDYYPQVLQFFSRNLIHKGDRERGGGQNKKQDKYRDHK
jgi:hypothetical protein